MKYHFYSYQPAIRFHLSNALGDLGWSRVYDDAHADFSDRNLILDDQISQQIEYKHLLWQLIKKKYAYMMPQSYCINDDNYRQVIQKAFIDFPAALQTCAEISWILKPSMLNNGDHIYLFSALEELLGHYSTPYRMGGEHILQRYIQNPALVNGYKYSFRIPVIMTNYAGVFAYHDGYINISNLLYQAARPVSLRKMHLTNYMLDGKLANIRQELASFIPEFSEIYQDMCMIMKHIVLLLSKKFPTYLQKTTHKVFEIFGFDFMLDQNHKMWLLEINQGPDFPLNSEHPLNKILWSPFWKDVVNNFVLPIATTNTIGVKYQRFNQLLSPKSMNKWYRLKWW